MDKQKLILPVSIIFGCIVLGSAYVLGNTNRLEQLNSLNLQQATSEEMKKVDVSPKQGIEEFDLDLAALSYKLPAYTKICFPKSRFDCSLNDGCVQKKPTVFILYNEALNKVYRCDNQPCSGYGVRRGLSGLYINLVPEEPTGSLWKISLDNEYTEIVSLGTDIIKYSGLCQDK